MSSKISWKAFTQQGQGPAGVGLSCSWLVDPAPGALCWLAHKMHPFEGSPLIPPAMHPLVVLYGSETGTAQVGEILEIEVAV